MRKAAQTTINFLTSDNYRDFEEPSVDFSIRFGEGAFGANSCDLLFSQTCQIIASPAFLAANKGFDPLRLNETIDPIRMFDHGDPYGHGWMTWKSFALQTDQSLDADTPFRRVESYPTMLDMICAGEGIGIGYRGLEERLVEEGKITRVGPALSQPERGYFMVYGPRVEQKKSFIRLKRHLLSEMGPTL